MGVSIQSNDNVLKAFFDEGLHTPLFSSTGSVYTAYGLSQNKPAYAIYQNGQPLSRLDFEAMCRILELASTTGRPVVTFYDSSGVDLTEGMESLKGVRKLNSAISKISGVVPQIAVVIGTCGASSALAATNADIVIMLQNADFFLEVPVNQYSEKEITDIEYAARVGVASVIAANQVDAARIAAAFIALLPSNNRQPCGEFKYTVPNKLLDVKKYSPKEAIESIVDSGSSLEFCHGYGKNIMTALATIEGHTVGLVATAGLGKPITLDCSSKVARFVRFCDAFSLPVISIIYEPDFESPSQINNMGESIRAAARMTGTYADATTAKISIIVGKAIGVSYMSFAHADLTIMLNDAILAPVEPSAIVSVLYRDQIEESGYKIGEMTEQLAGIYAKEKASANIALEEGLVDFVADAAKLRETVVDALHILSSKREQRLPKKHGNISL